MRKNLIAGFTLIELLVVVAILGVLAAIGTMSYSTYVTSTKMTSAVNTMQQISLAQTEYFTDSDTYYAYGATCTPNKTTTEDIIDKDNGLDVPIAYQDIAFYFCVEGDGTDYTIRALSDYGSKDCKITFTRVDQKAVRSDEC